MVKMSTFCRLAGSIYLLSGLALVEGLLCLSNPLFAQVIAEPGIPTPQPPPIIPREKDPLILRRKEREEKSKVDQEQQKEEKTILQEKKTEELAKSEAQKSRPLYGFFEISLLKPSLKTQGDRSNYVADMTVHANFYIRTFWNDDVDQLQPWLGFRVAPFAGTGTQSRQRARFAHTWLGPALGFGRIYLPSNTDEEFPVRYGYLLSFGVSAVQRLSIDDEVSEPIPKDFQNTSWTFESPGAWIEFRGIRLSRGVLGLHLLAGLQMGQGKNYYYGGLGMGGYY